MMLAAEELRVVLVTTHVPFRDVPALLTQERVIANAVASPSARLREWWGIAAPRLALCALNPHAGESGLFGDEEARVLRPAAEALGATGPLPADTVFVRAMRGEFDAVLAPYHDVGMTAIKVAAFGRAVNVTLGLPFPRTSPDHGTAFDIAGTGIGGCLEHAERRSSWRWSWLSGGSSCHPERSEGSSCPVFDDRREDPSLRSGRHVTASPPPAAPSLRDTPPA